MKMVCSGIPKAVLEGLLEIRPRHFSAADFWRRFHEHARRVLQLHGGNSDLVSVRPIAHLGHIFYRGQKFV
jgi:hypothetical protein